MRFMHLIATVCVVLLVGVVASTADDKPEGKEQKLKGAALVADRIWWGAEFELTLTVPDTGEKFQRTREGVVWDHLVFSNCFALDGKGGIVATVRFPKTKDEFTLRSIGPAEDLYTMRIYDLEKTFPKLLTKIKDGAKDTPDVKVGRLDLRNVKEMDSVPPHLLAAVAAATLKYEEKRPELMLRVKQKNSHLFFPSAAKSGWSVHREGDRLVLATGCADKMYHATFQVEFRKKPGGGDAEWEYVRIYGEELWKGE